MPARAGVLLGLQMFAGCPVPDGGLGPAGVVGQQAADAVQLLRRQIRGRGRVEPGLKSRPHRFAQLVVARQVPHGDHGAAAAAGVAVGGVQQAGVADHQVAGPHRYVHLVRMALVRGRGGRILVPHRVVMPGADGVVDVAAQPMGARQQPQAAILRPGIHQVPHQEQLMGCRVGGCRLIPERPVLVPVERTRVRLLGDHVTAPVARPDKAEPMQRLPGLRQGDQLREHRILVLHGEDAPLPSRALLLLVGVGVEHAVGDRPQPSQQVRGQQPRHHAEPLVKQLAPLRRQPYLCVNPALGRSPHRSSPAVGPSVRRPGATQVCSHSDATERALQTAAVCLSQSLRVMSRSWSALSAVSRRILAISPRPMVSPA